MNENTTGTLNYLKNLSANALKKAGENWRIITVGIIVIAIFASSWQADQKAKNPQQSNSSQASSENSDNSGNTNNETKPADNTNVTQAKEETNSNVAGTSVIKQTAARSEGITHLARRAAKEYLASSGETLSPEQKIYVEDYLKRQIGSQKITVGQTLEFNEDVIKTGVEKAKALNEKQIKNLSKYVPLVKNLN